MKICSNCKNELIDDAKFCSECGLEVKEEKKLCQNCGSELEKSAKFCIECGTAVALLEETVKEECAQVIVENTEATDKAPTKAKKSPHILAFAFAVTSLVCAVLSAGEALRTVFLLFPSMIVFLILSKCFTREYYKQADKENKFIKAARILTKIALPVGIVFAILSVATAIISFLTSPAFTGFVEEIVTYFNETVYDLLAK